jgi:peptidoglycan/LPS O-acetylase OafA/YrhL
MAGNANIQNHWSAVVDSAGKRLMRVSNSFGRATPGSVNVGTSTWDERLGRADRNAFDVMRLALATLVVLEHSYFLIDGTADRDPLSILSKGQTNSGQLAVYMFFSLSGFLVTSSLLQSSGSLHYIKKRVARIVPGFLVASAFGCLIVGPLTSIDIGEYFRSQNWRNIIVEALALKQVSVSGILEGNPLQLVHGTLWTIRYEFDCYIVLALLGAAGFLRPNLRLPMFMVLAAVFAVAMTVHLPIVNYGIAALFISSPDRWPDLFAFFFVGSAFFLFREQIPKSAVIFVASVAAIASSFVVGGAYWAFLFCGTYVVLFVSLSFGAEVKLLGQRVDLSYGVYLYGWPIQQMILFYYAGMKLSPAELFRAALLLSYLTAWISWSTIERPSLRLVRNRSFKQMIIFSRNALIRHPLMVRSRRSARTTGAMRYQQDLADGCAIAHWGAIRARMDVVQRASENGATTSLDQA